MTKLSEKKIAIFLFLDCFLIGLNFLLPRLIQAEPHEILVAAAADLKFAFDELREVFEKAYPGVSVKVTYGSSGHFFAQLSNKAPFDLYLSADIEYPRKLIEQGYALPDSAFQYAVGQIVLWTLQNSKVDVENLQMDALVMPSVRRIALANPEHAPYGKAAEAAMKKLGVYGQAKSRLALAENVAQAAQFVEVGAADVGIIALSLAMSPDLQAKGRYWLVPMDAYPRLEQGGVVLTWAKNREAVETLRQFIMSEQGKSILARYGFVVPDSMASEKK